MPKKVVLLTGSPRPEGNTAQVIEECVKVIKGCGVETEVFSLAGKRLSPARPVTSAGNSAAV
ncbi:MAG: NAD(P)H-dependent oxidoreductase [Methanomicrobiales archaeon]